MWAVVLYLASTSCVGERQSRKVERGASTSHTTTVDFFSFLFLGRRRTGISGPARLAIVNESLLVLFAGVLK